MDRLTNIIEAILFASGRSVPLAELGEKLNATSGELKKAVAELRQKYDAESGIQLLEFNKKLQFATNPAYKEEVASVLNPIREKELTRTILETIAIIAYKQPVTRTEIEVMRGANSNYAVDTLLQNKLIYPCGRKDAVGRPVLFATTDDFLKRFKLNSLEDLPDYDALMERIRSMNADDRDSYLYAHDVLDEAEESGGAEEPEKEEKPAKEGEGGYEIPDFLRGLDDLDLVKIS